MQNIDIRHPCPVLATLPAELIDDSIDDVSLESDRINRDTQDGHAVGADIRDAIPSRGKINRYIHIFNFYGS